MGHMWPCVLLLLMSNFVSYGHSQDKPKATLKSDQTNVLTSNSVTLTCTVEDSTDSWKIYWYRDNTNSEPVMVTDNSYYGVSRYSFQPSSVSESESYWCRGGRKYPPYYTQYSNSHSITVSEPVPVLSIHPWPDFFFGETLVLKCTIQKGRDSVWEYEWWKYNNKIKIYSKEHEYVMQPSENYSSGEYKCRGRRKDDQQQSKISNTIIIYFKDKPKATLEADQTVIPVGGSVTLNCSVEGSSGWKYFFYQHNTQSLIEQHVDTSYGPIRVSEGGIYRCRGGRGGSPGLPIYYTEYSNAVVRRSFVIQQPSWSQLFSGENITLKCKIQERGGTDWIYEWHTTSSSSNKPENQAEFRIDSVYESHSGDYWCKGRPKNGLQFSTGWSDAVKLIVSSQQPKATLKADQADIPVGASVTLTCSVEGSTEWKFYWYQHKNTDFLIVQAGGVQYSDGPIRVSEDGIYRCRGGRGEPVYYTAYSDSISMNTIGLARSVVILQPSWSQLFRGETITLKCEIQERGDTDWIYEWKTTSYYKPEKSEFRINSVSWSYGGDYWCKGRSKNGLHSSTGWSDAVKLSVSNRLWPVLSLSARWLTPGASVTLSCDVKDSSAGWRYHWYRAVPTGTSDNSYTQELLPGSDNGTVAGSYIIHAPTGTGQYVCKAGRGDPIQYTEYSQRQLVWSGDVNSSASLTVSPDRTQHFISESVTLSCEGNSTEWSMKRFTDQQATLYMTGSTWIRNIYTRDSGVYWCESGLGEYSNAVNITVHDGPVILVSPVHPVIEGDSVTLRCKFRTGLPLSNVDFYRNEELVQAKTNGQMIIPAVSKSDEGFYKCNYSGGESPKSWMAVRLTGELISPLVVGLIVGLVVVILLTIPLVLLCRYRTSKDQCSVRHNPSQGTNQGSAAYHRTNQSGALDDAYCPLQHGNTRIYGVINHSDNYENVPGTTAAVVHQ